MVILTFVHPAGNAKRESYIESFNGKFRDEFLDESDSSGGPGPADHREFEDLVKHRASTQLAWPSDARKVCAVDLWHRYTVTSTPSCRPTNLADWGLIAGDIAPGASSVPTQSNASESWYVMCARTKSIAYHWHRGNETLRRLRAVTCYV